MVPACPETSPLAYALATGDCICLCACFVLTSVSVKRSVLACEVLALQEVLQEAETETL